MGHDASTLRFRWLSARVVYTFVSLIGILYHLYFCVRELITGNGITYAACGKWSSAWMLFSIVYNELTARNRVILEKLLVV